MPKIAMVLGALKPSMKPDNDPDDGVVAASELLRAIKANDARAVAGAFTALCDWHGMAEGKR